MLPIYTIPDVLIWKHDHFAHLSLEHEKNHPKQCILPRQWSWSLPSFSSQDGTNEFRSNDIYIYIFVHYITLKRLPRRLFSVGFPCYLRKWMKVFIGLRIRNHELGSVSQSFETTSILSNRIRMGQYTSWRFDPNLKYPICFCWFSIGCFVSIAQLVWCMLFLFDRRWTPDQPEKFCWFQQGPCQLNPIHGWFSFLKKRHPFLCND